ARISGRDGGQPGARPRVTGEGLVPVSAQAQASAVRPCGPVSRRLCASTASTCGRGRTIAGLSGSGTRTAVTRSVVAGSIVVTDSTVGRAADIVSPPPGMRRTARVAGPFMGGGETAAALVRWAIDPAGL